jgi:hypothetical protein
MSAIVIVIVTIVVTVVVVRIVRFLVVPMFARRVMHVRCFAVVMYGMMVPSRETLFGGEARDRCHHGAGHDM